METQEISVSIPYTHLFFSLQGIGHKLEGDLEMSLKSSFEKIMLGVLIRHLTNKIHVNQTSFLL